MTYIFVYGTLKNDGIEARIRGFEKRTDAAYPTIAPNDESVVNGELIEVNHAAEKDRYEGCKFENPDDSLYWRFPVGMYLDETVWVYVGNPDKASKIWMGESWNVDYDFCDMTKQLLEAKLEVER